ncbi:hypothetical protein GCM10009596_14080 [Arthrobacter rhombi]
MFQAFLADDVPDANQINILCRNLDCQISLRDLELEIHLLFALDRPHLDLFDHRRTVVRVNNRFANLKNHLDKPLSRNQVYHEYGSITGALPAI